MCLLKGRLPCETILVTIAKIEGTMQTTASVLSHKEMHKPVMKSAR